MKYIYLSLIVILTSCATDLNELLKEQQFNIEFHVDKAKINYGENIRIFGTVYNPINYRIEYYNTNNKLKEFYQIKSSDFMVYASPEESGYFMLFDKIKNRKVIGPIYFDVINPKEKENPVVKKEAEKTVNNLIINNDLIKPSDYNERTKDLIRQLNKYNNLAPNEIVYWTKNDIYDIMYRLSQYEKNKSELEKFYAMKIEFEIYKNNKIRSLDSIENYINNFYNDEVSKLNVKLSEFEYKKKEYQDFFKNSENVKRDLEEKIIELGQKTKELAAIDNLIQDKKDWIEKNKKAFNKQLDRNMALGASIFTGYTINMDKAIEYSNLGVIMNIDYHFNITIDDDYNKFSNRVGIFYKFNNYYDFGTRKLVAKVDNYQGIYFEVNNKLRLSYGKNLTGESNIYDLNNFAMASYTLNNYPYPVSVYCTMYSDNQLYNKFIAIGINFAFDYGFTKI